MECVTIGPVSFDVDRSISTPVIYVHISINGAYWDSREFQTEAELDAFLSDPLAECRPAKAKFDPIDTRFLDYHCLTGIYRRVA